MNRHIISRPIDNSLHKISSDINWLKTIRKFRETAVIQKRDKTVKFVSKKKENDCANTFDFKIYYYLHDIITIIVMKICQQLWSCCNNGNLRAKIKYNTSIIICHNYCVKINSAI